MSYVLFYSWQGVRQVVMGRSVILPEHFHFMMHSVLGYPSAAECDTLYFGICLVIKLQLDTMYWSNRNDSCEMSICLSN